jgi:hypothetical protein
MKTILVILFVLLFVGIWGVLMLDNITPIEKITGIALMGGLFLLISSVGSRIKT